MPDDVEVADDSWHAALSESYDKAASAAEPPAVPAETPAVEAAPEATPSTESQPDGRQRDEQGRFVKQDTKPVEADKPAPPPAKPPAPGQGVAAAVPAPAAPPAFKLPQSWKASVRDLAAKLPQEFRPIIEESLRRDKEAQLALQARAEMEKGASGWKEVVSPYEAQFRQAGVRPEQYVGDLLKTVHALTYSQPHQQADILADIVLRYGAHLLKPDSMDADGKPSVPLDRALVARMQGQQAQPQGDPRVDRLLWEREQERRAQAATAQADAEQMVSRFAETHEFFDQVGEVAADWIDLWKSQGKKITDQDMEKAYQLACQSDEDVSKTISQRKAVESAATAQVATQRAKTAASSVRSTPGGNGSGSASPGDDWDSHIRASWDKAAQR